MLEKLDKNLKLKLENIASPEDFSNFEKKMGPKLLELSTLISSGFKKSKEATKNIIGFVFKRVLPAYIVYVASVGYLQKSDGKFSEKERARQELEEKGITSEQESSYKMGMSEMLYRGIVPWGYQNNENSSIENLNAIKYFPGRIIVGREQLSHTDEVEISPAREDAWRFMLGLPQKHNTFGVSDYKPNGSKEDKFYFKINGFDKKLLANHFLANKQWNELDVLEKQWVRSDRSTDSKLDSLEFNNLKKNKTPLPLSLLEIVSVIKSNGGSIIHSDIEGDMSIGLMGHFKLSCGEDEKGTYISYYDKWDLDNTFMNLGNHLTRAYEIYDRIYYNPETGTIIDSLLSK